jgi:uncharacterized protein YyaL (SSP411 family)
LYGLFSPQTSILVKTAANAEQLSKAAPFTRDYFCKEGQKAAFYVCQNQSCSPPVENAGELLRQINL